MTQIVSVVRLESFTAAAIWLCISANRLAAICSVIIGSAIAAVMYRRYPLPRTWLMTDERLGDGLIAAIKRLPQRSGVVFRHFSLPDAERYALFIRVRQVCKAHGHVLLISDLPQRARGWRADGVHRVRGLYNVHRSALDKRLWLTVSVHNARELIAARHAHVDAVFISPVFSTRSHPGARSLGRRNFASLAHRARCRVFALGGMTARHARTLRFVDGWAAIDAWA